MVRFLRGIFLAVDGYALQDFEAVSLGDITETPFEFIGQESVNGCRFEPALFIERVP